MTMCCREGAPNHDKTTICGASEGRNTTLVASSTLIGLGSGLESLSEPHVKHLEGKLWELRLRDVISSSPEHGTTAGA